MPRIHQALSGHSITYPDPDPKLEKFLKRVQALVDDRKATENDLVTIIYGRDNPLLDQTLFPERGAVTREVLDNPVYSVLTDLLARKHAAVKGVTADQLGKRYTLTVVEAATAAEVTQDAIRKAIAAKRLPSWVRGGQYYLDPASLAAISFGARKPSGPLEYQCGYDPDGKAFLQLKVPGGLLPLDAKGDHGQITKWRRVAVLTGGHGKIRYQVLEPSPQDARIDFHGFFVAGKFRVVGKVNNMKEAREGFESFRAS